MVLAIRQHRASGLGEAERPGPHLWLGLEGWLGVFVTAPPHEAAPQAGPQPLQTQHRNQLC